MDGSVGQNSQFECGTFWYTQPVKADERGSDMLRPSDTEDEPCSSVLDRLKTLDGMVWYGILEFNVPLDTV